MTGVNHLMDSSKMKNNYNKLVKATLANWRTSPNSKWAFHHVREIVPSAEIQKDSQYFWKLESQVTPFDTTPLTLLINSTSTDSVVIIHQN